VQLLSAESDDVVPLLFDSAKMIGVVQRGTVFFIGSVFARRNPPPAPPQGRLGVFWASCQREFPRERHWFFLFFFPYRFVDLIIRNMTVPSPFKSDVTSLPLGAALSLFSSGIRSRSVSTLTFNSTCVTLAFEVCILCHRYVGTFPLLLPPID